MKTRSHSRRNEEINKSQNHLPAASENNNVVQIQKRQRSRRNRLSHIINNDDKYLTNKEKKNDKFEILNEIWIDPSKIGSFRGPRALYIQAKQDGANNITYRDCVNFLRGKQYYTEYRSLRKNFPRNVIKK